MKLQDFNGRYNITLPKVLIKAKKWEKGQKLQIFLGKKGELIIAESDEE